MPDLFCHAVSGYLLLRPKWQRFFIPEVFLLGCILPDLIRGPLLMLTNYIELPVTYTIPLLILHSPLPLLFQAILFSQFFEESIRGTVFKNLIAGITLHLFLDMGQRAYHISYLWLFPFSFENPIRGLWWADDGIYITMGVCIIGIIIYFYRKTDVYTKKRDKEIQPCGL